MPRGGPGLAWSQEGLPGGGTTSQDFSKLKKEDSPSQAEACALLVAKGECEVRTVVPGQGAGQPSGQGRPGPRQGRSLGEGAGEGAVEVAVDVAAAGGEAGSLQLPRGPKPVLDQADSRHLVAVDAPGHCHTAQQLSGHRRRAHPGAGCRAQCVHLLRWPQPWCRMQHAARRAGTVRTSTPRCGRSKPLAQLPVKRHRCLVAQLGPTAPPVACPSWRLQPPSALPRLL